MTREEIRKKINDLNKEKSECERLKSNYSSSLNNSNKILEYTSSSISQITQANDDLKKYYNINGKAVCQDNINSLKSNINNVQRKINIIKSESKKEMNNLNNEINEIRRKINALELEYKNALE